MSILFCSQNPAGRRFCILAINVKVKWTQIWYDEWVMYIGERPREDFLFLCVSSLIIFIFLYRNLDTKHIFLGVCVCVVPSLAPQREPRTGALWEWPGVSPLTQTAVEAPNQLQGQRFNTFFEDITTFLWVFSVPGLRFYECLCHN